MARRGFTLIETLVSLAMAAFLISGTAGLMIRAARLKIKSDILTASAGLVRDRLARLRSLSFDDPDLEEGGHGEVAADRATGRVFRVTWQVEDASGGRKAVRLRAEPERSPERAVEARVLLDASLGF